ncbi:AVT protein, partial [Atractosteus spatula]|nr:AVT protein [Atractosteus spatula]
MALFYPNISNFSVDMEATQSLGRNESLAKIEIALLAVIFLSASVLNTGLLLVLWKRRKQVSRMRVFVLHLCLADLVVAFFQICPQLIWDITDRFIGPDALCRAIKYLQIVGMFASTYMIVVMTIDRYQAICNPMVTFQRKRTRCNVPVASSVTGVSKARIKTVKMTVVIVVAYIVCWAPFFTVQLWSVWDVNAPIETATFTILMLLASLNSCANPCIYLLFSGQLPKKLVSFLCRRQSNMKDSAPEEATVVSTLYMSFKRLSDSR